jgi:glutathione S-transferase
MPKMSFSSAVTERTHEPMKLYRFRHSPYARKVQMALEWLSLSHEKIEVPYGERNELATLTGGYIYVPVLVTDAGQVITESRDICSHLTREGRGTALLPSSLHGPVWAYHDWADGPLEDVMFKLGSPNVRDSWPTPWERALYVLIKERKFGAGCVDTWKRDRHALLAKAQKLLAPSVETLARQPFLFGERPTLADAALYGNLAMLNECDPKLVANISPELASWVVRAEQFRF